MSDVIFDATVVAFSNVQIERRRTGNTLDTRLCLLEKANNGQVRIRYNSKLLFEYVQHVKENRNDVIEIFVTILDSPSAISVGRNTLSRQHHQLAIDQRWPNHDEHLLAAALNGDRPSIYVTERRLANCASGIHRVFRIHVHLV